MTELVSVASGYVVDLGEVRDEVFSQKMLGDGYGLLTHDTSLYSPVSGTVTMVYDTGHAIGIHSEDGTDILIHIGIDTVELGLAAFTPKINSGEKVDQHTVLTEVNWPIIQEKGYDGTVLVIGLDKKVNNLIKRDNVSQGVVVAETLP